MEKSTADKSAISKDMTKEQTIFYVGQKVFHWRLTPQGFLVSNAVIVRVLEALSL